MTLQIPGYTFIKKIGEGGCADVYLAVQENLNRRVAMKLLKHSLTSDKDFHKRFNREGRIIAQLSHPHIVSVYDIGVYEHHYYMSMEYLPAGDLKSCAQQFTLGEFLEMIKQIVQALDVAHQQGFVHRDIKPSNILFREPNVAVLTDFGIARKAESLTQMTMTGAFLGTPAYMSPEQINGQEVDGRTDLYSLGVTLFEMLSGYQPYRSNSAVNVVIQHLNTEIPMLPTVTAPLQPIVNSLLCKDPAGRMPSAMALNDALQELKLAEHLSNKKLTSLWSERVPYIDVTTNIYSPSSVSTQQKRSSLIVAFSSLFILVLGGVWSFTMNESNNIEPAPDPTPIVAPISEPVVSNIQMPQIQQQPEAMKNAQWQAAIAEANQLREQGLLLAPNQPNALALYREVLAQDVEHVEAKQGEQAILSTLVSEVDELIFNKELKTAKQKISLLQSLWPGNTRVAQLQTDLNREQQQLLEQARAKQARELQQKITTNLRLAEEAMVDKRYLRPPSDNVLYYLQQTLQLSSNNAIALDVKMRLASTLLSQAQTAIVNRDFVRADSLIDDVRTIDSNHAKLNAIKNSLAEGKIKLQKEQEQQKRQLALEKKIEQLTNRTTQWNNTDEALSVMAETGNQLLLEINRIASGSPENLQLQDLQYTVKRRLQRIENLQRETENVRRTPAIGF